MLLTFAHAGALIPHRPVDDPALVLTGFAEVQVVRGPDGERFDEARGRMQRDR